MPKYRLAGERALRPCELALPAVGEREGVRLPRVTCGEAGERAQTLPLGRSALDRPGQARERPPRRVEPHVGGVEEPADGFPEGARLAGRSVVCRCFPDERQELRRPRARGVEQVAVATRRIGTLQAGVSGRVEVAPRLVVEEWGRRRTARQRALLQP